MSHESAAASRLSMRSFCGLVLLLAVWTPALSASVDFLEGGTFICHHPPGLLYSQPPPEEGWYWHFLDQYGLEDADEQNPAIATTDPVVWFVLAAFPGEKEWCGTEFGFGEFDPLIFDFLAWGPCTPLTHLEIPTAGWPGPSEGTAIVTTDVPWQGEIIPVYYFAGYASGLPGSIPLAADPQTGFVGWGNCLTPPEATSSICLPEMGFFADGVHCYPDSLAGGVCCVGEDCFVTTEQGCADMQGEWHPDWPNCDGDNVCVSLRVCCIGEECSLTSSYECYLLGGEWHDEWDSCDPNRCLPSPFAACCRYWHCYLLTEDECLETGGTWHPEWPDCGPPDPCDQRERVCCVGENCYLVTAIECQDLGGDWYPYWHHCEPENPCQEPYRVCCLGEECIITTVTECEELEGIWHAHYPDCGPPNPCGPLDEGVCCVGEDCYQTNEYECRLLGGEWHPDWPNCDGDNVCASLRVCCISEECSLTSSYECHLLGGEWHEEWSSCDPNPCIPSPTEGVSWGRIKSIFH